MKAHVLTTQISIGRRLLAKTRLESSPDDTNECSGVLMGDEKFAAPLAVSVLLFSAHLLAPDEQTRNAIERAIHVLDPNAVVVTDAGFSTQHGLSGTDVDDIPF